MKTNTPFDADRLNRKQAAEYLGLAKSTLDADACRHQLGIPLHKFGSKVIYRRSDLDAWIASRRVSVQRNRPRTLLAA